MQKTHVSENIIQKWNHMKFSQEILEACLDISSPLR